MQSTRLPRRTALVIGAGIAGPAVALFLQRAGITPVIYERHPGPTDETGAFLNLAPNGLAVLETLDIAGGAAASSRPTWETRNPSATSSGPPPTRSDAGRSTICRPCPRGTGVPSVCWATRRTRPPHTRGRAPRSRWRMPSYSAGVSATSRTLSAPSPPSRLSGGLGWKLVREARRNGRRKAAANPLSRRIRDLVLPFFLERGVRSLRSTYDYRVDWRDPAA